MTAYDGAVRIQGKDGSDLRPWRVTVYERCSPLPDSAGGQRVRGRQARSLAVARTVAAFWR